MIQVQQKDMCPGCHVCYNVCPMGCISMQEDDEGFWYPVVDKEVCINCSRCEKACPINRELSVDSTDTRPRAYAAWNKNETVRATSSSGGVFSALCEFVLLKGGVIFGAAFDENFVLAHSMVEKMEDYGRFRGSKYLQSRIGKTYLEAQKQLEVNRMVLFSGTPCQIAGLRSFLGKDYQNLITCDLVCHGVPSPKVFSKYRLWLEQQYGSLTRKISFREKSLGWKSYDISLLFDNDTGYKEGFWKDPFMQGFLKNVYLRPSCHNCHFSRIPRIADITLADFWGVSAHHPEWDDDKGTSLVLVNTLAGARAINACKTQLTLYEAPLDRAIAGNPCMVGSVRPSRQRKDFFNDLDQLSFDALARKYCFDNIVIKFKKQAMAYYINVGSKVKRMFIKLITPETKRNVNGN